MKSSCQESCLNGTVAAFDRSLLVVRPEDTHILSVSAKLETFFSANILVLYHFYIALIM